MISPQTERRAWPRRSTSTWAVVSTFWLAASLLYAVQIAVMSSMPGENFRLAVLLAWQVPFWTLWAAVAPLVLRIGDRFPLDGQRWTRSLPIHLAALVVIACAHAAVAVAISQQLDSSSRESFWMAYRGFVVSRFHIELMVYAATIAVGYALESRRRLRERELSASRLETQLANARLDALRMQLNPHFLFNTLHTVAALVRSRRHDDAVTMIAGLSDLLRRTLDGQRRQETSLADELTFVERYLDIQRVRFGDPPARRSADRSGRARGARADAHLAAAGRERAAPWSRPARRRRPADDRRHARQRPAASGSERRRRRLGRRARPRRQDGRSHGAGDAAYRSAGACRVERAGPARRHAAARQPR